MNVSKAKSNKVTKSNEVTGSSATIETITTSTTATIDFSATEPIAVLAGSVIDLPTEGEIQSFETEIAEIAEIPIVVPPTLRGVIYKLTCATSGKSYIGQTIQGDLRKQQHKFNAFSENYSGYYLPFYCAIRKYGFDSFKYEILITINNENLESVLNKLNELEIYYIGLYNSYNNGYNSTIGGQGISGITHPSCRKVIQYDNSGNFINVYDSAIIAARSVNLNDASAVLKCCKFKVKSSGGFQ